MPGHYAVLGIDPAASAEQIEQTYKKLARTYHPDVNSAPDALSTMQAINAAYHVLRDPQRRRDYDQQLGQVHQTTSAQRSTSDHVSSIEAQFARLWQQCYPLITLQMDRELLIETATGPRAISIDFVYEPYCVALELGELLEADRAALEAAGWRVIVYPMVDVYLDLDQRVHEVYQLLAQAAYAEAEPTAYQEAQAELAELEALYQQFVDQPSSAPATSYKNDPAQLTPFETLSRAVARWWARLTRKNQA